MIKKVLIFSVVFILVFLSSCGKESDKNEEATTEVTTAAEAHTSDITVTPLQSNTLAESTDISRSEETILHTAAVQTSVKQEVDKPISVPASETGKISQTSAQKTETTKKTTVSVVLTVNCKNAVDAENDIALKIASDGFIINNKNVELKENSTVFDLMTDSGLVIGFSSSGTGKYIYSINSLAEKDCGNKSGWIYKVNGSVPQKACSDYVLQEGDTVEWVYTLNGGRDV